MKRRPILVLSLLVALLVPTVHGCWRTPLTQPKESILYYGPEGKAHYPGVVIRAPQYMEMLRDLRAQKGITEVDTFKIKPNLRLHVEVVGVKGLDRHVDVSPNGKIFLPHIGEVVAEGRTLSQLNKELEERYSKYYEDPQVIVNSVTTQLTAAEFGGLPQAGTVSVFSVSGRMDGRPFGQYRTGGTVNLRGDERVMDALAKTFALHGESEWRQIAVLREPQEGLQGVIIVDAARFFMLGHASDENIPLKDGDVIFVPTERNTWIEEVVANLHVMGGIFGDAGEVANFINAVEDIGE